MQDLITAVTACTACKAHLPLPPKPILQVGVSSRILIIGQAPGLKAHQRGRPFDDPSGVRLREWLGVSEQVFYDPSLISLMPMGFCFPGSAERGDKPPRPECAPLWHAKLLAQMPEIQLTLLLGRHAHKAYWRQSNASITQAIQDWQANPRSTIPLLHPSPRNNIWLKRNPWYQSEFLPLLKQRVAQALG
ncbi:uracil-DNA glycosylase family protein [Paraferrimonas sedimenticola]|nr:uracil-DNA glycosylase family protein [Paraferrimonas sedimenticola]